MVVISGGAFNKYNSKRLVKVTNKECVHNNFIFKKGLIIDTVEFNPDKDCSGIYFVTIDRLFNWIKYNGKLMYYIWDVIIPDDALVCLDDYNKFKADKIILHNKDFIYNTEKPHLPYIKQNNLKNIVIAGSEFNKFNTERFVKLTNKKCVHNNFVFKNGLNINTIGFSSINRWYQYIDKDMYYIWNVIIPDDALVCINLNILKTNKIILQNKQAIHDQEKLCIEATTYNCDVIKCIKNKTLKVCLGTVKRNGYALEYIDEQTEEICLAAVKEDGLSLEYVENQTDEICISAVKENGVVLEYVNNQTDEICLAAVKQDGWALEYVKNQTEELCLAAVKQYGRALQYVENQTDEICHIAVKNYGEALKYVNNQTEELCLAAVKKCCLSLRYVKNKTEEMCLIAVKEDGCILDFVKNQTDEMCLAAIKN